MTLILWLAYVAASGILLAVPGPTILLVVSYALAEGRRSALATVAGAPQDPWGARWSTSAH